MAFSELFKNYDVLEKMVKSNNEDSSTLKKVTQMNTMVQFVTLKSENPNLTQTQLAKKMGVSKSTLYRTQKDLGMPSFYRYDVPMKTKKAVELTTEEILTLQESEDLSEAESERLNKYLQKNTERELMKTKKQENKKTTVRELKSKANEILSSRVIEELKTDKRTNKKTEKNKNLNKRGGGFVLPKECLQTNEIKLKGEEYTNSDDELDKVLGVN
jgi:transcriptional regulator with XRE-family HTH domain